LTFAHIAGRAGYLSRSLLIACRPIDLTGQEEVVYRVSLKRWTDLSGVHEVVFNSITYKENQSENNTNNTRNNERGKIDNRRHNWRYKGDFKRDNKRYKTDIRRHNRRYKGDFKRDNKRYKRDIRRDDKRNIRKDIRQIISGWRCLQRDS